MRDKPQFALHAVETTAFAMAVALWSWFAWQLIAWVRANPEPTVPAEAPPGQVLRRLEIRLHEPLDKGRGDRYRIFECSEVPRERPKANAGDATPGGSVRTQGAGEGAAGR